jgi:hypothetical protein
MYKIGFNSISDKAFYAAKNARVDARGKAQKVKTLAGKVKGLQGDVSSARLDLEFEDEPEDMMEYIDRVWRLEKEFVALAQHEQAREINHWVIAKVFRKMDLIEDVFIGQCISAIEEVKLRMKERGDRSDNDRRSIWSLQRKCYDLEARKKSRTLQKKEKTEIERESPEDEVGAGVRAVVFAEDLAIGRCRCGIEEVKLRMKCGDGSELDRKNIHSFKCRINDMEVRKKLRIFLNSALASQRQVINAETGVELDICELLDSVDSGCELYDLELKPIAQKTKEKTFFSRPGFAAACAAEVESHVKDRPKEESDIERPCDGLECEEKVCEYEYFLPAPLVMEAHFSALISGNRLDGTGIMQHPLRPMDRLDFEKLLRLETLQLRDFLSYDSEENFSLEEVDFNIILEYPLFHYVKEDVGGQCHDHDSEDEHDDGQLMGEQMR